MVKRYKQIPSEFGKQTIWFIISTKWVRKWQRYVYFDCIDAAEDAPMSEDNREHPGRIDCSDIIETNENMLHEPSSAGSANKAMNVQI